MRSRRGAFSQAGPDRRAPRTTESRPHMASYLLIESRDPFDHGGVANDYDMATALADAGHEVTLFLVQNGVLPARKQVPANPLGRVLGARVQVLADDFSLRERGIRPADLAQGVQPASLEVAVDQLAEGRKAVWL